MDLMVDTVNQKLAGAHGDHPVFINEKWIIRKIL